jgi:hypothetical protein
VDVGVEQRVTAEEVGVGRLGVPVPAGLRPVVGDVREWQGTDPVEDVDDDRKVR